MVVIEVEELCFLEKINIFRCCSKDSRDSTAVCFMFVLYIALEVISFAQCYCNYWQYTMSVSCVCLKVDLEPTGKLHAVIALSGCLTEGSYPLL